jgi:hypothetical protein
MAIEAPAALDIRKRHHSEAIRLSYGQLVALIRVPAGSIARKQSQIELPTRSFQNVWVI